MLTAFGISDFQWASTSLQVHFRSLAQHLTKKTQEIWSIQGLWIRHPLAQRETGPFTHAQASYELVKQH